MRPNWRPGFAALFFAVLSILVFVGASIWFWFQAPDPVPSHFGADGQPDDWSSKGENLAILGPLGIGIPLAFSIRWIWEKLPTAVVNIPHKEYWLQRGQRDYFYDCLMEFLRITAGGLALLFTAVLVQMEQVGQGKSIPEGLTFLPTAAFLVIMGIALWNLLRQLKPQG